MGLLLHSHNYSIRIVLLGGVEAQAACEALRKAMMDLSILAIPNFDQLFMIESDASRRGVGVVLVQNGRPLAFMSKVLSEHAQKKSVYEQELMAIVLAIQ